jgi:hypothetical protein
MLLLWLRFGRLVFGRCAAQGGLLLRFVHLLGILCRCQRGASVF